MLKKRTRGLWEHKELLSQQTTRLHDHYFYYVVNLEGEKATKNVIKKLWQPFKILPYCLFSYFTQIIKQLILFVKYTERKHIICLLIIHSSLKICSNHDHSILLDIPFTPKKPHKPKTQIVSFKLLVSIGVLHMCFQTMERVKKVLTTPPQPTPLIMSPFRDVQISEVSHKPSTSIHVICSNYTFSFLKKNLLHYFSKSLSFSQRANEKITYIQQILLFYPITFGCSVLQ